MKFKTLKDASTVNGYGITLQEIFNWKTGEREHFAVSRFNKDGKFVVLSTHKRLTEARAAANRIWVLDMRASRLSGKIA